MATTDVDFACLHDFFRDHEGRSGREPADHALVFCIQAIEAPSLLLPVLFCLENGTLDGAFVHSTILAVLSKVQYPGLRVRHILADGASFNLLAFKLLLGHGSGAMGTSPHRFGVTFPNPDYPDKVISVSVCR